MSGNSALVLLSGGQDSATCLAWALEQFESVSTIGFEYGQRHAVEMDCRSRVLEQIQRLKPNWKARLGDDHVLDASILASLNSTALTSTGAISIGPGGLPTTFVPGRNILFLTLAGAVAYRHDIKHIVAGVCQTDSAGYPDCRDDTIKAMQLALNGAMARQFAIHTPLMWLRKSETWGLAMRLGGAGLVELILEHTHTCYLGERKARHPWGYGCNSCPACKLRKAGFQEWTAEQADAAVLR